MIFTYLITILVILGLLAGWIAVQHLARLFASRHPELGPAREEGGGCGGLFCLCKDGQACPKEKLKKAVRFRSR
ncbi:MAG: chemotaxis protein [Oceanipulchritudo sp.]